MLPAAFFPPCSCPCSTPPWLLLFPPSHRWDLGLQSVGIQRKAEERTLIPRRFSTLSLFTLPSGERRCRRLCLTHPVGYILGGWTLNKERLLSTEFSTGSCNETTTWRGNKETSVNLRVTQERNNRMTYFTFSIKKCNISRILPYCIDKRCNQTLNRNDTFFYCVSLLLGQIGWFSQFTVNSWWLPRVFILFHFMTTDFVCPVKLYLFYLVRSPGVDAPSD